MSSLGEYAYCPRRCGLHTLEQVYHENLFTLRGTEVHEIAHMPCGSDVGGVHVERALPLFCDALGIHGVADVVEFRSDGSVYPVEYKPGKAPTRVGPSERAEAVQLCGQALCLEAMFSLEVPAGAIYYHGSRARREILMTEAIRERTLAAIDGARRLYSAARLPEPVDDARCPACSLIDACVPSTLRAMQGASVFAIFAPMEWEGLE